MASITPYTEGSLEFAQMLQAAETGEDGGRAAFAAGNCYMYGSSRFCQDWYEYSVLKNKTTEEYDAHVSLIQKCMALSRNKD